MKKTLYERDRAALSEVQKLRFCPFDAAKGRGAKLWDSAGKEYLDFTAGWGVANTGYNHPEVVEAVNRQMNKLSFASTISVINEESVVLAEKLIELTPGDFPKSVWYGHSGSDANEFISKIVPEATGKSRILTFVGSYHGQTMGAYAMSGHPAQSHFTGSGNVVKLPYPDCYRCAFEKREDKCSLFCLRYIENYIFKAVAYPEQIGAIEIEAIQCDGGDILPATGFLKGLEQLCRKHNILLIIDEVKIGFGRTGRMFGFENWDIVPDLVVMGKPLGAGQPLSAVVGRKEIMDAGACLHLFTTAGNPVACASAMAGIEVIKKESLKENAVKIGSYLLGRLEKLKEKHECMGDVRGRGLVMGIDLVKDRKTKEPYTELAPLVVYRAYELGLLIYDSGLYSNVLEITPPLIITRADADKAVDIIDQSISDAVCGKITEDKIKEFAGWNG